MEEKWWSKYQTKNSADPTDEKSVESEVKEETVEPTETDTTKEILEEAVHFVNDLNEKINKTAQEVLENEKVKEFVNTVDTVARNTADTIITKSNEFLNSAELQQATEKAKEVMNNMVNEVRSWSEKSEQVSEPVVEEPVEEPTLPETYTTLVEVCEDEETNPILKDINAVKKVVSDSLNKKEVVDTVEFVKNKAQQAKEAVEAYSTSPSVTKAKEFIADKAEVSKQWMIEKFDNEEVSNTINYMKEKTEGAKQWVYQVYNKEEVQEGIEKAKESVETAIESTKSTFTKVVNDPRVQEGYVNAKETTTRTAKNVSGAVKKGLNEFKSEESLAQEFNEWKYVAVDFTKRSARVIGAAVNEIAQNEQVQTIASKSKELIVKGTSKALSALNEWAEGKQQPKSHTVYLENKKDFKDQ
ncbi:MAG: hypothetical protein E7191_06565 [Erysipelotrichaceae bacterium]|nr:hypothetical protein [Erysipelotrichaceae bacterium]